jgi:hypothetical protein
MTPEEQIYQNEYRKIEDRVKEVQRTTDINFSPYYNVLPELINQRGYQYGLEIGLFAGGFSKAILERTNLKLMVGIDPYKEYAPGLINMGTISSQTEFDIMCRLAVDRLPENRFMHLRMTSDEAFKYIMETDKYIDELYFTLMGNPLESKDKFDFCFIDGEHTSKQLTKDLDNYSQLIRKGGIVAAHDYMHGTFPNLTIVIDNFVKKHNANLVIGPLHLVYMEKTWD